MESDLPVLIIGAGISGLLLAQQLRQLEIPFLIFERDDDFTSRGSGWGLTLHWSLPALRELLPGELLSRLPETYVDRAAVERNEDSTFPFFDLSTGEKKGAVPRAGEHERIRVSREKLRQLLATSIDIKWGKAFKHLSDDVSAVDAHFEDGSTYRGRILFGCDGNRSRVRQEIFGDEQSANHPIPVSMFGFTMQITADEAKPIRSLDPFFLQGTASASDVSMYTSLLKAPQSAQDSNQDFVYQVCVSGSTEKEPFRSITQRDARASNDERLAMIKAIAMNLSEPFRSFLLLVPDDAKIKQLDLDDWSLPRESPVGGNYTLVGDAAHAMTMFLGAGANHAIIDVRELKQMVLSLMGQNVLSRTSVDAYQRSVALRTLPTVLASRQACLEAHDWANLTSTSHLLSARQMVVDFDH